LISNNKKIPAYSFVPVKLIYMDTSEIEKKFNQHNLIHIDLKQAFEKAKIKIRFPTSNEVVGDFGNRMSMIFYELIMAAKFNNLYAGFILYRALLEHFFKASYIIDRILAENDEVAEKYKKHLFISEVLAEQAGVLDMEDLINEADEKTDFVEFIAKKFPDLKGFDKSNQQEISAATKQFNLKYIVKYLYNTYKEREVLRNTNFVIAQTFPEFSKVSTFTHGGIYASVLMEKFIREKKVEDELTKILHISLTSVCVIKENFFMTYEIDSSFKELLNQMQEVRSFPATKI
jgi:hypothetical protein